MGPDTQTQTVGTNPDGPTHPTGTRHTPYPRDSSYPPTLKSRSHVYPTTTPLNVPLLPYKSGLYGSFHLSLLHLTENKFVSDNLGLRWVRRLGRDRGGFRPRTLRTLLRSTSGAVCVGDGTFCHGTIQEKVVPPPPATGVRVLRRKKDTFRPRLIFRSQSADTFYDTNKYSCSDPITIFQGKVYVPEYPLLPRLILFSSPGL